MTCNPDKHHRRSIRLAGYDYTQAGGYHVTIVTQGRECLFGGVMDGEIEWNDAGRMLERWWAELGNKYPCVIPDTHIVMPNHFHGIVIITDQHVGADPGFPSRRVCPGPDADALPQPGRTSCRDDRRGAPLPAIVQWFKTMTTNEYIRRVKTLGWPPFAGKLWQRNYYEHIIRNGESLDQIRRYIIDNPAGWGDDDENPERAA